MQNMFFINPVIIYNLYTIFFMEGFMQKVEKCILYLIISHHCLYLGMFHII